MTATALSPAFWPVESSGEPVGDAAAERDIEQWVRILETDPELRASVPLGDQRRARRVLTVPGRALEAGAVDLGDLSLPEGTFALLVVAGELSSDVLVEGRGLSQMLLPGDLVLPSSSRIDGLHASRRVIARQPSVVAVLERRFLLACARWPGLMTVVQSRLAEHEHRLAAHGAICQLPRVEQRLVAMMRLLASRVGRVRADGTVVPLRLTHETLGGLIGARRPTVSLAIKELESTGSLQRLNGGGWLLPRSADGTGIS